MDTKHLSLPRSTPEKQGIDPDILNKGYKCLKRDFAVLHSLLVLKNGNLVFERYNTGPRLFYKSFFSSIKKIQNRAVGKLSKYPVLSFRDRYNDKWNVRAVTKSIVSVLTGICLDKGYITSLDEKILDYFPEYTGINVENKRNTTIRHLLTMTSGIKSIEENNMALKLIRSGDWAEFILNLEQEKQPGKEFCYNSADAHLLSVILSKASGMDLLDFARKYLFGPLDIENVLWEKDSKGYRFGGGNLFLSPVDMLKTGMAVLNKGVVNGSEIIPADWIADSLKKSNKISEDYDYGYYWYIKDEKIYSASGAGGQKIYIIPGFNLVVVSTGKLSFGFDSSYNLNKFIEDYLLPALK